jgi:hypothetical protein
VPGYIRDKSNYRSMSEEELKELVKKSKAAEKGERE